ncbi:MAG: hypothetical protein Harvfovirus6_43 [Harvfovirus sp.]|uniref:Uncharacterized protein n=1 Tax=Harvfovirus sp. TaxID=2487768 RepID=A0A3G5A4P6_9VIRU|nr:MAG: hypothetical protein Harvfovirus6_43 [Harvfovirus sp.]
MSTRFVCRLLRTTRINFVPRRAISHLPVPEGVKPAFHKKCIDFVSTTDSHKSILKTIENTDHTNTTTSLNAILYIHKRFPTFSTNINEIDYFELYTQCWKRICEGHCQFNEPITILEQLCDLKTLPKIRQFVNHPMFDVSTEANYKRLTDLINSIYGPNQHKIITQRLIQQEPTEFTFNKAFFHVKEAKCMKLTGWLKYMNKSYAAATIIQEKLLHPYDFGQSILLIANSTELEDSTKIDLIRLAHETIMEQNKQHTDLFKLVRSLKHLTKTDDLTNLESLFPSSTESL